MFHLRGLTCQRSLQNGTSSAFVDEFASILHLFIRAICGETTWTLTVFSRRVPNFEWRKLYVLPMALSPKAVLKISCVSHPVYPSLKPSSIHILCFFNQSLEHRVLHLTATINTRLELLSPPPRGAAAQCGPWPHSLRFLNHTQRRATVGRTPLDRWSAHRKDLYLTTHITQQTSMPPVGFEPTIPAGERSQTYSLDRAATGTGTEHM